MKHAYLILAHGEYKLLELLVASLDDARNDIFVHIDAKAQLPEGLRVERAGLQFISERHDVRWGDVSVVEAEFALFRAAYRAGQSAGGYAYYHLLSGVDLPIKTQDYIHDFCQRHQGSEFIGFYSGADLSSDLERKVQRRHLFARHFRGSGLVWQCRRIVRALYIRLQQVCGIRRYAERRFAKGTQWMSITEALVAELIRHESSIVPLYRGTFCSDEIAIQTFVASSPFMTRVYKPEDEAGSCLRHIGWHEGQLIDFSAGDYEALASSQALFARKFNSSDMDFIHRVLARSLSTPNERRDDSDY
ncbi:MAG: beta-1,6-N-acetylglucosaminyltransferase [Porphyromonas sp.]|nr:beta-1,6-N-acetylglucosaminyltransferase [Porphyromonas sp.]